jgi:magnesium chelatase family protein
MNATVETTDGHRVEAWVSVGLPGFHVVGLAGELERTWRDRLRAACLNLGLVWPTRRITLVLHPAPGTGGVERVADLDVAALAAILRAGGGDAPELVPTCELRLDGQPAVGP